MPEGEEEWDETAVALEDGRSRGSIGSGVAAASDTGDGSGWPSNTIPPHGDGVRRKPHRRGRCLG